MQKKGVQKKGVNPSIVIVLAVFLVVLSVISVITVNNQINARVNALAHESAKTNGQAQVSVTVEKTPIMSAGVEIEIKSNPSN